MSAKAISLINFVNSRRQVQVKMLGISGSILFDNLLVFLKDIFLGNNDLERKFSHDLRFRQYCYLNRFFNTGHFIASPLDVH